MLQEAALQFCLHVDSSNAAPMFIPLKRDRIFRVPGFIVPVSGGDKA